MPPRGKYKKRPYKRKRNYKKKYYKKASLNVIPTSIVKKFKFVTDISIDPGLGTASNYTFGANGAFKPDLISNHQPYGWDQYMGPMYQHAIVLGSKISCLFTLGQPQLAQASNNILVGIQLLSDQNVTTNAQLIRESGKARWGMLTNATTPVRRTFKYSAKKFHALSNVKDNNELTNTTSSNPAEMAYFNVFAMPCAPNVDALNTTVQVVIEYICLLNEPVKFGQS